MWHAWRPPRGVNLPFIIAQLSPCGLQLCAHHTMWYACDRTAAPVCALIVAQLSPRGLQPCARRLLFGSLVTASRCRPALYCRSASVPPPEASLGEQEVMNDACLEGEASSSESENEDADE